MITTFLSLLMLLLLANCLQSLRLEVISDPCDRPYLVRLELMRLFGCTLKLHTFLRGDQDRERHDHPWAFVTWIIVGFYWEEYQDLKTGEVHLIRRDRWDMAYRPARWRHRVVLSRKPTEFLQAVTIVFTFPKRRDWGFWRGTTFIPWRKFDSKIEC